MQQQLRSWLQATYQVNHQASCERRQNLRYSIEEGHFDGPRSEALSDAANQRPERRENEHLVPGRKQRTRQRRKPACRARRHEDLVARVLQAVTIFELLSDRLN